MAQFFFGPSDGVRRELFPRVNARIVWGESIMLSFVHIERGAVVERHSHPHEQMGMVIEGKAEFIVGDQRRILQPGDMYWIPGGVEHEVRAVDGPVRALDVFHPLRQEYMEQHG